MRLRLLLLFAICSALCLNLAACGPARPLAPVPTVAPSPTPTYDPKGPNAPPYDVIRDTVKGIVEANSKDADGGYAKVQEYLQALSGKKVVDWHAWIFSVRQNEGAGTYRAQVLMDDPYAEGASMPETDPLVSVDFALDGLTATQRQSLHIGDEIKYSGTIADPVNDPRIEVTSLETVAASEPSPTVPADIKSAMITLQRTSCFGFCPVYTLTISGDGTVVWQGEGYVKTRGQKTTNIGVDRVRELLAFAEKIDYFSLKDEYKNMNVTDNPDANTSVSIGGKSKTINHYLGDRSAPTKLVLFEDKIDEVVNTAQWIENGPDSIQQGP